MERWLIALHKIGKALPYLLVGLVTLAAVALGVYEWKKPELARLEAKDPYRYEQMVQRAFGLHWIDAWNQYQSLETVSAEVLYRERYERWKRRLKTDRGFREDIYRRKAETQKKLRQDQQDRYKAFIAGLERSRKVRQAIYRKVHWEQATPWQKSLILRDGCVRYLSQEVEDYRNRRRIRGSLKGAAVLAHAGIGGPGTLCREMVSLAHDEPSVERSLLNLQKGMNHYYFIRLLEDAGIPDSEWFSVTDKLEGMTRDFNGY